MTITEAPTNGEEKARKAQPQQNNQASTKGASTVLGTSHTQWHQQLLPQNKCPVEKRENKKDRKGKEQQKSTKKRTRGMSRTHNQTHQQKNLDQWFPSIEGGKQDIPSRIPPPRRTLSQRKKKGKSPYLNASLKRHSLSIWLPRE